MTSRNTAQINGQRISVNPDQDLLTSALAQGLDFPHSCRVGGCGTCKCKLVSGQVKELTESAYLLTDKEVRDGYILACQSRPQSDLVIEVEGLPLESSDPQIQSVRPKGVQRAAATAFDYLKYFSFHWIGLFSLFSIAAGKHVTAYGLLGVVSLYMLGDEIAGDDTSEPAFGKDRILTYQLWIALPLLTAIWFVSIWSVSSEDALGFGRWASSWTGYDLLQARAATSSYQHLAGLLLAGLMVGLVGTITGHELTHRTWDRVSLVLGRWLLAFSFDTSFSIEHVYGHHRYVSTDSDPATAPRGRSVYFHILASTAKGNLSAWKIEKDRLHKQGASLFSVRNVFIRGQLMSLALLLLAEVLGGRSGLAFFVGFGLVGKALLEIVNYMEHYGIVRNPHEPVHPRHSWNTNKRVSSWTMFNLTRHSHHHAQGEVPYHLLRPMPDAPMMVSGYLTTIFITLLPPLWRRIMKPKLRHWDEHFATPAELDILAKNQS